MWAAHTPNAISAARVPARQENRTERRTTPTGRFITDSGRSLQTPHSIARFRKYSKWRSGLRNSRVPLRKSCACALLEHDPNSVTPTLVDAHQLPRNLWREVAQHLGGGGMH